MARSRLTDDELHLQITTIANRFQLFQCQPCAEAIQEFLMYRGIAVELHG